MDDIRSDISSLTWAVVGLLIVVGILSWQIIENKKIAEERSGTLEKKIESLCLKTKSLEASRGAIMARVYPQYYWEDPDTLDALITEVLKEKYESDR